MATNKPRITVTLEPQHHALLKRLAELQGVSMSHILVDLFGTVAPVLERVAVALQAAQQAQASVKPKLKRTAEESEAQLQPLLEALISQLDIFTEEARGRAAGSGSDAPAAALNPHYVTRGSGHPTTGN